MTLTIEEPCDRCGKPTKRRRRTGRAYYCAECGPAAAVEFMTRLHNEKVERTLVRNQKRRAVGARADP